MRRDDKFPDNGFEAWGGYMQAKVAKLDEQYLCRIGTEEKKLSDIFSGICIYVNGYTVPSSEELKTLMSQHGGVYHTYQRTGDFIIASNLPDTKVKNMSLLKVVSPEWITNSIASNCLLDYRDFLLYKNSRTQPKLDFTRSSTKPKLNVVQNYNVNNNSYVTRPINIKHEESLNSIISNKIIQSHVMTKTAADSNFISEFYNNSRLHHISQLGACFKQYINDLRESAEFLFPARITLKERIHNCDINNLTQIKFEGKKVIMHIDMDCFFVSVGLRERPELRGKPVAVTHSKGGHGRPKRPGVDPNKEFSLYKQKQVQKLGKATGVPEEEIKIETKVDNIIDDDDNYGSMSEIASCSYEARAKGVHNGMLMGAALKLCPDLKTIPYDFEGYKEVAYTLYNTIAQYTLDIEAVSCDEMYVDCTDLIDSLQINVQELATELRREIKSKTRCPCSTGFGGNRLQARLATKRAKPDGQFFLAADLVEDFMFNIKLTDLPGVGRQTAHKLKALGHTTCGSLQDLALVTLQQHLGHKTGAQLFNQCRGKDPNPLVFHTVRKSVSAEVNYGIRFENSEQCNEFLKQLSTEVHSRMAQCKVSGKCITLKLMVRAEDAPVETAKFMGHGYCNVINKSSSLSVATNDIETITREVLELCKKQNIDPKEMRGIGIQVSKLETLNIKPKVGAMSRFLCNSEKLNNKPDIVGSSNCNVKKISSPQKIKTSPFKQSPVKGKMPQSPTSKKRSRPPKIVQASTSKNHINKFLIGNTVKDTPYKNPMQKDLSVDQKSVKVANEVKQEGLLGLSWQKVRELLRAWLESGLSPLPCDVEMISEYMREMVISKNISDLNILIKFLRRRTKELNDYRWIDVYNKIIDEVQNAMVAVYGKELYIGS